jgi:hypothetical protein
MTKTFKIAIAILIVFLGCTKHENNYTEFDLPYYNLNLKLNSENSHIEVDGYVVIDGEHINKRLTFALNKGLELSELNAQGVKRWYYDTVPLGFIFMPDARRVILEFEDSLSKTGQVKIHFSYSGQMEKLPANFPNKLEDDWVELGLYYPWFPYFFEFRHFTYTLNVQSKKKYQIASLGNKKKEAKSWVFQQTLATNDIVVCASQDLRGKLFEKKGARIQFYYQDISSNFIDSLGNVLSEIEGYYNNWLGKNSQELTVVFSPRKSGGGYARNGGIFLSNFNSEKFRNNQGRYTKHFAHEIGHLWWNSANVNSWHDWINEGFAEYFALLIIKNKLGKDAFLKHLDKMKQNCIDLPPIWGFDRTATDPTGSEVAYLMLYQKAPLLLYELDKKIGHERFLAFAKELNQQKPENTTLLLSTLNSYSPKISKWFTELLKEQ